MNFEWDQKKNLQNIKKHGISFETASYVFTDPNILSIIDKSHSINEVRWVSLGLINTLGIFVVVHTEREQNVIRIISARKAVKREKDTYTRLIGV